MSRIDVRSHRDDGGWICDVRVREGPTETRHEVTIADPDLARLAPGANDPAALVRSSFAFLLEREPKESILRAFDLPMIGRYFPEYEREIPARIGRDEAGSRLGAHGIEAAATGVPHVFRLTPQFVSETLSARVGARVVLKVETVNPIGSFKGRGAWLAIHELVGEGKIEPERGVVAASTGNFGQAVAYAGRAHGVPVTIFAGEHADPLRLDRIRRFGARVVETGHDFDAARAASAAFARERHVPLLVDGEEPHVAIGAGTIAFELTKAIERGELPAFADVYIPVGNGALIAGVGTWLRHASPRTRVVGVQSEAAPSTALSWRAKRPIETPTAATFADGIATRVPVPEALAMMEGVVDEMLLVSEDALRAAQAELTAELGITVEGAAAASWAGLLADPGRPPDGANTEGAALVLVTGSNVAPT